MFQAWLDRHAAAIGATGSVPAGESIVMESEGLR
jgi:hypothetical protein